MTEAAIQSVLRRDAHLFGAWLDRNNSGAFEDANGRTVRYGHANTSAQFNKRCKSSDLLGITRHGKFLAVECKPEDWTCPADLSPEHTHLRRHSATRKATDRELAQHAYMNHIRRHNGVAGFVQTWEDFQRLLQDAGQI